MTHPPALDCWFLTGPTAAGKTSVGIELARRIGAEIVSMDSMGLYRGMDVGTAKPTPQQRAAIAHHMIDVIEPHQEYSLAQYVEDAGQCIESIRGRGREALFVGGTPLYLKGLLRGIFEGPPADWGFREQLRQQAEQEGPESLHRRLAQVDPAAAQRLHPNDARRLIRALEVYAKNGRPISQLQQQFDVGRNAETCRVFVLHWSRQDLHARIDARVDAMFAAGLVDEVRGLLARPQPPRIDEETTIALAKGTVPFSSNENRDSPPSTPSSILSRTARKAVGYREVIEHLAGRRSLPETVELVRRHTRQLAKRQETWFRGLSECRFVPIVLGMEAERIAEWIASGRD